MKKSWKSFEKFEKVFFDGLQFLYNNCLNEESLTLKPFDFWFQFILKTDQKIRCYILAILFFEKSFSKNFYYSFNLKILSLSHLTHKANRTLLLPLLVIMICSHRHNILRISVTLPNFLFTTSETKCDY